MLLAAAILVLLVLALSWGRQAWWSLRLAAHYPLKPASPADDSAPEVVVLLPLRGADPGLRECLRAVLRQDYPRYEVHIIVDSDADPAWRAVLDAVGEYPGGQMASGLTRRLQTDNLAVDASVLFHRLPTCSLKVSALLQGVESLPDSVEVVAQLDADVVPPPHWLRELTRPFADPAVAAVSGLRWYHPNDTAWGSLVRMLWGGGAAAQMHALGIPWGGTLAYRASVLRDPELRRTWEHSFVEDTSAADFLASRGLKLHMLPRLTMINSEVIDLGSCYRFLRRQVLCVRLHHPRWLTVLWTAVGMNLSLPLVVGCANWAFVSGEIALGWTLLGAFLAVVLAAGLPLAWIDGWFWYQAPPEAPLSRLSLKHIPVILVTLVVHQAALLAACFVREVDWRGIRYSVGPGGVRRLTDGPYVAAPERTESII